MRKYFLNYTIFCQTVNSRYWKNEVHWGIWRTCVWCRYISVFVRGTVHEGPKLWKGAWVSWASAQSPRGPAGLEEWGISSNPKQNSAETAQQALQGGVQPPVKNRGEITKLYKPQRDKNQDQRKEEVRVQTPGQHFLRLPKYHQPSPNRLELSLTQRNQRLPKPTSGMSKVILQHEIQLIF